MNAVEVGLVGLPVETLDRKVPEIGPSSFMASDDLTVLRKGVVAAGSGAPRCDLTRVTTACSEPSCRFPFST